MAAAWLSDQEILSRRKENLRSARTEPEIDGSARAASLRCRNGTGSSRLLIVPYHSHSAQWEFYHVISGGGVVRHHGGKIEIEPGDAFLFKPNEPHQIINNRANDLILYIVADNPIGESCHYPDSEKWAVKAPEFRIMRGEALDYYDGEE